MCILAEVLITLGIIGVVAAMTIPNIITHYQKLRTASHVKKFYTEMNNAVRMSVAENGDVDLWVFERKNFSYQENLKFLQYYILPYIKYLKYENCMDKWVCVYLTYGMFIFMVDGNGGDILYFINGKGQSTSRNRFAFQFNKSNRQNNKSILNRTLSSGTDNIKV